jgi:dTMP kinase
MPLYGEPEAWMCQPWVVIEGPDGAGKTTVLELFVKKLAIRGIDISSVASKQLPRKLTNASSLVKAHFFALHRCILAEEILWPHVLGQANTETKNLKWLVVDRWLDSGYAYQVRYEKFPKFRFSAINQFCCNLLTPNLTFILTCSSETAASRLQKRDGALTPFDIHKHRTLSKAYLKLVMRRLALPNGKKPRRILVDAEGTPDEISDKLVNLWESERVYPEKGMIKLL